MLRTIRYPLVVIVEFPNYQIPLTQIRYPLLIIFKFHHFPGISILISILGNKNKKKLLKLFKSLYVTGQKCGRDRLRL